MTQIMTTSGEKETFMSAQKSQEDLEKIKKFLHENSISLSISDKNENYIDHHTANITVSANQSEREIVYTILHELGHYFLAPSVSSNTHVAILIEEVLAWDRGRDIAEALSINIDDDEWSALVEKSIGQYMSEK